MGAVFVGMNDFSTFLKERVALLQEGFVPQTAMITSLMENEVRRRLGVYNAATGIFPAWKQLAARTMKERSEQGFSANEPLLRSRQLYNKLSHTFSGFSSQVGYLRGTPYYMTEKSGKTVSDSIGEIAMVHEFGSGRVPPRPFLGPSAYETFVPAANILQQRVFSILLVPPMNLSLTSRQSLDTALLTQVAYGESIIGDSRK